MNVKTRNVSISLVCLIGTATVIYGVAYYWVLANMQAGEAAVASDLSYLHEMLIQYYDENKTWPAKLDELKVDRILSKDRISRKPYLYCPDARYGTGDVLVAQPEYFRLGLCPFGEVRRYVVLARRVDFHVFLQGQDAVAFRKKG